MRTWASGSRAGWMDGMTEGAETAALVGQDDGVKGRFLSNAVTLALRDYAAQDAGERGRISKATEPVAGRAHK